MSYKNKINEVELKNYLNDAITQIMESIKIKSIASKPAPNAPYGTENKKMLDFALSLAKKLGFEAHYGFENRYGYAEFGEGDKIFGILCHLDVVPAGDLAKWKKAPWEPLYENGVIYGRGAIDDKGPTMITLYALKYLKDHGYVPKNYKIRVIFGLTEEETWDSIKTYVKHEPKIDSGYVPDGEWPVIYAEKTIVNADIIGEGVKTPLTVTGGEAYNMISDNTVITGADNNKLKAAFTANNWNYEITGNNEFISKGVSGHGSEPARGKSAIIQALYGLAEQYPDLPIIKYVKNNFKNNDFSMPTVFPNWADKTGVLTSNVGFVEINKTKQRIAMDLRVPVSHSKEDIIKALETDAAKYGLTMKLVDYENSKYVDPKDPMVVKMMAIYKKITGDTKAQPIAIGGGTYARAADNIIAFGAADDLDSMHGCNEQVTVKQLEKMLKIYIIAIPALVDDLDY